MRKGCLLAIVLVVVLVAGIVLVWTLSDKRRPAPGCSVTAAPGDGRPEYTFTTEGMGYAATIAAVGMKLGMPEHAATIALATALQESGLRNLPGGDRDSLGLFQQRPSQGWGTPDQIKDPVYAATAFYKRLAALPGWADLPVTVAAQEVQRSGAPDAYAQWEPTARAAAAALTGLRPAALTCHDITPQPTADLVATAKNELGTAALSGAHPSARGWALSSWLVAHAAAVGVDQVSFEGKQWTAESGSWSGNPQPGAPLALRRAAPAPPS
ncbi:hypothetical protein [Amycolatopsis sp. CA-230715]|uniref:hypothetical protein n=1 Tax=Amycolatopsis sp. CA-230715 TaxID=2745196 RepID=UPI001C00CDD4|nr:hypothetical protein [Amycolatopsis sp. CA-230715]QWF85181.1 hypothetical protein HUW46_08635 [Amycolatopsis sp. CA-230715]